MNNNFDARKICRQQNAFRTWYCWYSEIKSFMFDSASVNSISSMPMHKCDKRNKK